MDLSVHGRHGALPRRRAAALFGHYETRAALDARSVVMLWPGVLVDPARQSDPLTLASAALYLAGPDALLTGPTAAFLHGYRAADPTPVHVAVPYGDPLRTQPGLVVHNSRTLEADRASIADLPALHIDRVVTDLLCTASPPTAFAILDDHLRLATDPEDARNRLLDRIRTRADPRGTRRAEAMLAVASGRTASPAESWTFWHLVDQGFPVPEVNWELRGPDGRRVFVLDLAWPQYRIVVEYDGRAAHAERETQDRARQQELEQRGWIVVRAAAGDLQDVSRLVDDLVVAFGRRGVRLARETGGLRGRRHREAGRPRRRKAAAR